MVFPASRRGSAGPAPAEQVVCVLQCLHPVQRPAGAWHPDGSSGSCWAPFLQRRCRPPPSSPSMGSPFASHCIAGLGFPLARQTSLPSSPGAKMRFWGSSSQYGAALKHTNVPVTHVANRTRRSPEVPTQTISSAANKCNRRAEPTAPTARRAGWRRCWWGWMQHSPRGKPPKPHLPPSISGCESEEDGKVKATYPSLSPRSCGGCCPSCWRPSRNTPRSLPPRRWRSEEPY